MTFVASLLERVIEEQARGDAAKAEGLRTSILAVIGSSLHDVRPGRRRRCALKDVLIGQGVWSQYLEVGIGPDAEIFTKCPPMSPRSAPAPTSASIRSPNGTTRSPKSCSPSARRGRVVGATLGNDVNLRDFEGRSALLLGKAKDNNASCAIGPFIRLFDEHFGMDDVRALRSRAAHRGARRVRVHRPQLDGGDQPRSARDRRAHDRSASSVSRRRRCCSSARCSRRPSIACAPGKGFTHIVGDVVTVSTPTLGTLVNRVNHTDKIAPWTFGVRALMARIDEESSASGRPADCNGAGMPATEHWRCPGREPRRTARVQT